MLLGPSCPLADPSLGPGSPLLVLSREFGNGLWGLLWGLYRDYFRPTKHQRV